MTWHHLPPRTSRIIFIAIKYLLFAITAIYIFYIFRDKKFSDFTSVLDKANNTTNIFRLLLVALLMFINWGLEAQKWRVLLKKFYKVPFLKSFKAILAGNAVSIWVPNRNGDFLGRLFFVTSYLRIKSLISTWIGGIAQLIVTLITGGIGLFYYIWIHTHNSYFMLGCISASVVLWCLILVVFFTPCG